MPKHKRGKRVLFVISQALSLPETIRKVVCIIWVFISLYLVSGSIALGNTVPLLERVQTLHCASDIDSASDALGKLWDISTETLQSPNEWLDDEEKITLYAASMDITLNTLVETAEKYPKLRNEVERTILQWSFCNLFEDGQFYDLSIKSGKLQKSIAAYQSPIKWAGFQKLGFIANKPATFIPELLTQSSLGERAFEYFFHRIYRKQCFPHPVTGNMFHTKKRMSPLPISLPKSISSNLRYPYKWNNECRSPKIIIPPVIKMAEIAVLSTSAIKPKKTPKQEKKSPAIPLPVLKVEVRPEAIKPAKNVPVTIVKKQVEVSPPKTIIKQLKKEDKKKIVIVEKLVTPKEVPVPVAAPSSNTGAFSFPTVISENPEKEERFTVGLRVSRNLATDSTSIGGSLSFAPEHDNYWFIRSGFNYNLRAKKDPFTYSWGIGFDDWHPETWSFQINHWGPIKPGEGLDFNKAIGNIGYKIKSETLAKFNLTPSTSLDLPIKGDPSLNLGMQWSPKENWFIRANINKGLKGGDPKWSYVFGYFNWRPGKINFEYANYGPNELFDSNYQKNGTLTVSYNLKF